MNITYKTLLITIAISFVVGLVCGYIMEKYTDKSDGIISDTQNIIDNITKSTGEINRIINAPYKIITDTTYIYAGKIEENDKITEGLLIPQIDTLYVYKKSDIDKEKKWLEKAKSDLDELKEISTINGIGKYKYNIIMPDILKLKRDIGFCFQPVLGMGYGFCPNLTSKFTPYIGMKLLYWHRWGLNIGLTLTDANIGISRKLSDLIPLVRNSGVLVAYGKGYRKEKRLFLGLTVEL